MAVPARVMVPLAEALAARGWDTIRLEFPGVGESPLDPRRVEGGMVEWATRDLQAALLAAEDRAGDRPVVLVGHSAGAWLIMLTPAAGRVDAVLGLSSMSGSWRLLKRRAWPLVVPAVTVGIPLADRMLGYVPGWLGLGHDAPGGALRQWAAWCRRRHFFFDVPAVRTYDAELTAPVRVLLASDDAWATPEAVHDLWGRARGVDHELVTVRPADHGGAPIGHVGLLRRRFAEDLWPTHLQWLRQAADGHRARRG